MNQRFLLYAIFLSVFSPSLFIGFAFMFFANHDFRDACF